MEFSHHLKQLREEEKLTQEELALRINVSRSAIAKWEQGKGMPSLELLKSLALFFHTSIDNLLGEEGIARFEKKSNHRMLTISILAIAALVIATVSTAVLLVNSFLTEETKIILVDEVSREGELYKINYSEGGKNKSFKVKTSNLYFRNLENQNINLNKDDYLKVELKGNEAKKAIIIDNKSDVSLKGYEITFVDDMNSKNYYFYQYNSIAEEFAYFESESDIPSIVNKNLLLASTSFETHSYQNITVSHTVYIDSNNHDFNLFEYRCAKMNMLGETIALSDPMNYSVGLFTTLNIKTSDYINSLAFEGDYYRLRDLVNYDITFEYVDTAESIRVVEYDQFDAIIEETVLEYTNARAFSPDISTSYLKYYEGDSVRSKTIEAGESVVISLSTGEPLPFTFILSLSN